MASDSGRGGSVLARARDAGARRERILRAAVEVVAERGYGGASVSAVIARAHVSRRSFEGQFGGLNECLAAVFDLGLQRTIELVTDAFAQAQTWREGVRLALAALLAHFDAEPAFARVWLVESLAAGPWALSHRERNLQVLREFALASWPVSSEWSGPPMAAEGAIAAVLGIVHGHIVAGRPEPLITLLGPAMGVVAAPYLSRRATAREVELAQRLAREILAGERAIGVVAGVGEQPERSPPSPTGRAGASLLFLAGYPGASNREVAAGIGVAHASHISRLLAGLARDGLAIKRSLGPGRANAWRLTAAGEELARASGGISRCQGDSRSSARAEPV